MPTELTTTPPLNRTALVDWFDRVRARSSQLFELIDDTAYYERPIALRNPIVFYEGHLPAFSVNVLIRKGLGLPGIDERLERLFARGIDPDDEQADEVTREVQWPSRSEVRDYARRADRLLRDALARAPIDQPGRPILDRAEGAYTILEHEALHQETLLYMWHQLPRDRKRPPEGLVIETDGLHPEAGTVVVPDGIATLGADRDGVPFGWDNEFEARQVAVPAFAIDAHNVTNRDYLAFVEAGGYREPRWWAPADWEWLQAAGASHPLFWEPRPGGWSWRAQFGLIPLPDAWPVYVSHAEASAYARWQGARLPSEAEYHRAAFGTPEGRERPFPWGDALPDPSRGNFDFDRWDPVPAGSRPGGASAWGVHDLVGNGWEWTATVFGPFPGFRPMPSYPEYSADFFDGQHYVMKGASPVTPRELLRRSLRNWFRPHYPYVYASFRCVRG